MIGKHTQDAWIEGSPSPRLRIYVQGSSGQKFVHARIRLQPDCIRNWDRKWYSYFLEYYYAKALTTTYRNQTMAYSSWRELLRHDKGEPQNIFLLPLYAVEHEEREWRLGKEGFFELILSRTGSSRGWFRRIGAFTSMTIDSNAYWQDIQKEELAVKAENYISYYSCTPLQ
jgi:hypothetical protein